MRSPNRSRLIRPLWCLSLLSWLWLWPVSVGAQEADASLNEARDHMERGQSYYLQGRFGEAAAEFEAAFAARPFAAFLYNAGVSYQNGGELGRAVEHFRRYLAAADTDPSDRPAVEARIATLEGEIAERAARAAAEAAAAAAAAAAAEPPPEPAPEAAPSEPEPPDALPEDFKSLVSISTVPEGASVTITLDGTTVASGPSPLSASLDQGHYRLRIEHPDYNPADTELVLEPGKVYLIQMNLSQGEFFGYLRVRSSTPGASVYVDDRDAGARGTTPFEGPVVLGPHHVWIERPGFEPVERDIVVGVGEDVVIDEDLARTAEGRIRVIGNLRGATIRIDGDPVGAVPWEGELLAGAHRLRVEATDMKPWEEEVTVERGLLTPVRTRLRPAMGRGGGWATLVIGALTLGGGITCSVLAHDYAAGIAEARAAGTLASNDWRIDWGFGLSIAQWGAYGLSALLLGLSVYYFVVDDLPPSDGTVLEPREYAGLSVGIAPLLDPVTETYGAALAGRF
jgi:hypothetical protein